MVKNKLKAILSRAFATDEHDLWQDPSAHTIGEVNCKALEERVLLSASPMPILVDADGLDVVDVDGDISNTTSFDGAFDAFNSAFDALGRIK